MCWSKSEWSAGWAANPPAPDGGETAFSALLAAICRPGEPNGFPSVVFFTGDPEMNSYQKFRIRPNDVDPCGSGTLVSSAK
jgi:hypothetical protein